MRSPLLWDPLPRSVFLVLPDWPGWLRLVLLGASAGGVVPNLGCGEIRIQGQRGRLPEAAAWVVVVVVVVVRGEYQT
jgi:hypothetical protein